MWITTNARTVSAAVFDVLPLDGKEVRVDSFFQTQLRQLRIFLGPHRLRVIVAYSEMNIQPPKAIWQA